MKLRGDIVIPSIILVVLFVSSVYMVYTGALTDRDNLVGEYDQVYKAVGTYDSSGEIHIDEINGEDYRFKITSVNDGFVYADTADGAIVGTLIAPNTFHYTHIVNNHFHSGNIYKFNDYLMLQFTGVDEEGNPYSSVSILVQKGWILREDPESLFPNADPSLVDRAWPGALSYRYLDGDFTYNDPEDYTFTVKMVAPGMVFYTADTPDGLFRFAGVYSDSVVQALALMPGTTDDFVKDTVTITENAIYSSSAGYYEGDHSKIFVVNYADDPSALATPPNIDGRNYEGLKWTSGTDGNIIKEDSWCEFSDQQEGIITAKTEDFEAKFLLVNNGMTVMIFCAFKGSEDLITSYGIFENDNTRIVAVTAISGMDGSVTAVRIVLERA